MIEYFVHKFVYIIKGLPRIVNQITKAAAMVCSGAIAVDICLQVFFRYVLNNALPWTEEAGIYLMIWMVFLGSSLLMRSSEHMTISAIVQIAPLKIKVFITLFARITGIIFLSLVAYYGFNVFTSRAAVFSLALGLSTKWVKLAIPVGATLMILDSICLLADELRHIAKGNLDHFRQNQ